MSLTTTAPLAPPHRHGSISMTTPYEDRPYPNQGQGPAPTQGQDHQAPIPPPYYSRPPSSHDDAPSSSHGVNRSDTHTSPERNDSSHSARSQEFGTLPSATPQAASYPPDSTYATPASGSFVPYYGAGQGSDHVPSPPLNGDERGSLIQFTPDGNPIVPVGISGGKMFQCRGFEKCDRVFTRSEHLARHVRKHTGERPFPCHCGKAFSRLDNLRQHAATVHSDAPDLNENMLNTLSPVHAALSARATKEQKKRGEVVEVPNNAVERPRNAERRGSKEGTVSPPVVTAAAYPPYADEGTTWDHNTRPRTSNSGYDYPFHPPPEIPHAGMEGTPGPSRRPGSSAGYSAYGGGYYEGPPARPQTGDIAQPAKGFGGYRSRDGPPPLHSGSQGHYADSEPPTSAHGPPQSPLYTAPPPVPQPNWSSPPPPHTAYGHEQRAYYPSHPAPAPTAEGYTYPEPTYAQTSTTANGPNGSSYGPAPPGSAGSTGPYNYPPPPPTANGYYGQSQNQGPYAQPLPPPSSHGHGPSHGHHSSYSVGSYAATQPNTPYSYPTPLSGPGPSHGPPSAPLHTPSVAAPPSVVEYQYPALPTSSSSGGIGKRRLDDIDISSSSSSIGGDSLPARKIPRASAINQPIRALQEPNPPGHDDDQLWFPPTTERRSSLAISALLGSPVEEHKPRAPWDGGVAVGSGNGGVGEGMEEKAKALLGSAH